MRALGLVGFGLVLAACDTPRAGDTATAAPYIPPEVRGAPPGCAELATRPGHAFVEGPTLQLGDGPLAIGDASMLGGPTSPPVRISLPRGDYPTRALIGGGGVRCVALLVAEGTPTSSRPLGDVVLDTDTLLFVDEARARSARQDRASRVDVTVEADTPSLDRVLSTLARRGRPSERLSPTLARLVDPAPADDELARAAMREDGAYGKVRREPATQGLAAILALGEHETAPFDGGVVVDARGGLRATRVFAVSSEDRLIRVEWSSP